MDPSAYMHQYGPNSGPVNHGQIPQVLVFPFASIDLVSLII